MENYRKLNPAASLILAIAVCALAAPASAAERTRDLSIGTITKVECHGRRLEMSLKTPHETLHLTTANYLKLDLEAENFTVKGKLNPCKEMEGYNATAIFYDVPRRPNDGDLISIHLYKPKSK